MWDWLSMFKFRSPIKLSYFNETFQRVGHYSIIWYSAGILFIQNKSKIKRTPYIQHQNGRLHMFQHNGIAPKNISNKEFVKLELSKKPNQDWFHRIICSAELVRFERAEVALVLAGSEPVLSASLERDRYYASRPIWRRISRNNDRHLLRRPSDRGNIRDSSSSKERPPIHYF